MFVYQGESDLDLLRFCSLPDSQHPKKQILIRPGQFESSSFRRELIWTNRYESIGHKGRSMKVQ